MDGASPFATPARAEAPRADVPRPTLESEALLPPPPRDGPAAGVADVQARVAQQMRAAGAVAGASPHASLPSPPPQQRQPAAAADSDSSVELVLRPMPPRAASLVGRRVALWRWWRDYPEHGTALQGVIEAALPPALQDGWRWRVRFEDGTTEVVAWPTLQLWLVCDDDGEAVQSPAAQPGVPPPRLAHAGGAGTEQKTRKRYKGVSRGQGSSCFRTVHYLGGNRIERGPFATAEEAARSYDDDCRRIGLRVVNFPRAGTNEVQAVPYETELVTLQRVESGVDRTRHRAPPQPSARSKSREALPVALRSTRPPRAGNTPVAPPPPHAAAAESAPPSDDIDPLVGRLVSLPYRSTRNVTGSVCKYYDGVVVAKRAGAYDVQLKCGYMEQDVSAQFVLKHTVTSAAGETGGMRKRGARAAAGNSSSHNADVVTGGAGSGSFAVPTRGVWKSADNQFRAVLCS